MRAEQTSLIITKPYHRFYFVTAVINIPLKNRMLLDIGSKLLFLNLHCRKEREEDKFASIKSVLMYDVIVRPCFSLPLFKMWQLVTFRFTDDQFDPELAATIGVDFKVKVSFGKHLRYMSTSYKHRPTLSSKIILSRFFSSQTVLKPIFFP